MRPNLVRRCLVALGVAATLALAGCQTLSGVSQSERSFASENEFRQWFAFYYKDPRPQDLTAALKYMKDQEYLDRFPEVACVFMSRVFADHPGELRGWTDGWQQMGATEWNVILMSLWLSKADGSKDLVSTNLHHAAPQQQKRLTELLGHNPDEADLLAARVTDPGQINMLWAAFSATGDARYVDKVIDQVHFYGAEDETSDIGEIAVLSLANNTLQHEIVQKECDEANASHPDPRTRELIRAMMRAVAQIVKENGSAQPAH